MRVHMGPYGPGPGPWRAGKVQEKRTCFLRDAFLSKIVVLNLQTTFLVVLTCPSDFWPKNHAERPCNYFKKQVLTWERAILVKKQRLGIKICLTTKKVRFSWTFPALQGPGPGPYGPTFGPISHISGPELSFWQKYVWTKLFFLNFSRSSRAQAGPIRAHMGPYGPWMTSFGLILRF